LVLRSRRLLAFLVAAFFSNFLCSNVVKNNVSNIMIRAGALRQGTIPPCHYDAEIEVYLQTEVDAMDRQRLKHMHSCPPARMHTQPFDLEDPSICTDLSIPHITGRRTQNEINCKRSQGCLSSHLIVWLFFFSSERWFANTLLSTQLPLHQHRHSCILCSMLNNHDML